MPMIWLDLKEAGDFHFQSAVKKFVLKNYGENPEAYNEELKKLELLRQNAIRVARDFEGCSVLRKYLGQLHYLQSRVPMGSGQEAAVAITWTEIFSGKSVAHEDIKYEQACILYNLGALHSMLGAMDKRVSEEGMKVSCTHFQCAAGAFAYLREHFPQAFSVDMSRQILTLNVNLMLGQAQECLLEKSMLDNRKSFLVARISAQVGRGLRMSDLLCPWSLMTGLIPTPRWSITIRRRAEPWRTLTLRPCWAASRRTGRNSSR